jgi:uncharacterized protein (TIGR02996 family)
MARELDRDRDPDMVREVVRPMPDMMAIVSKAVFEREAGKQPALGARLGMDRYVSSNKNLDALAAGGRLYLVTVRPPNEDLWLVAILDQPKHDGEAWVARKCQTPIANITPLRKQIKFASGTGITAKKGALGMSLQTPRALTAADAALLDQAAGVGGTGAGAAGSAGAAAAAPAADAELEQTDALLAAILAEPDSDEARRIYADLLAERGEPRGDFIHLELALDGRLSIRKRALLAPRRDELYAAHRKRWFPYAGLGLRTRHGFLHAVKGPFKAVKAAGSKLFAAEPVTEVELSGVDEDTLEPLLAARWLPRVRRLTLRGAIGDGGFARLAGAPAAAGLTALNVTGNRLKPAALANLGDGLPRCTTLVLTRNPIGDKGLAGLGRWKHLAAVETLYLSRCGLTPKGLEALLGQPLPNLTKLCLTGNERLGEKGAGVIAACAANLPRLRHIEVIGAKVGKAGVRALAEATLPALRRIDARGTYQARELAADPRVRI